MDIENPIPVRDQIIEYLKTLPEEVSMQEIFYHLYIRNQVIEAQQEIKKIKHYTDEEAQNLLR